MLSRPKCLGALLQANSSLTEAYPIRNDCIWVASTFVVEKPEVRSEAETVMKALLDTEEGKKAVDVPSSTNLTALMFCIKSLVVDSDPNELNGALLRVIYMLLTAGASISQTYQLATPLAMACRKFASQTLISKLLRCGANPNEHVGYDGSTCLDFALQYSQTDLVKILLKHGADINGRGPNGRRPFDSACPHKDKSCLKVLVDHPAFRVKSTELCEAESLLQKKVLSPEERYYSYQIDKELNMKNFLCVGKNMESTCMQLVSAGDIGELEKQVSNFSVSDLNAQSKAGLTAVHLAAIRNDIDMMELLLAHGAKLNIKDKMGRYPLTYAALNPNSLEVLDTLISEGADINAKGLTGKTALFEAAQANRIENVEYLFAKDASVNIGEMTTGTTSLHLMTQMNNVLILDIFMKAPDIDVNILNSFGASPLHYAAKSNSKNAAESLIRKGASINLKCTIMENTPLHVAAACNSVDVAQILIDNGCNVDEQNKNLETPLFLAAMTGSESVLSLLLKENNKIDSKNIHGQSPLYIAINYQEFRIAQTLISHGADIMAKEKHRNETILHLAISTGNIGFITFLISKGVDKEAKDCYGLTPLLRSAAIYNGEMAKALIEMGCDTRAALDSEVNFLDLVVQNQNDKILKEIVSVCPKTKKPRLVPALKALPRSSKEKALSKWEHFKRVSANF